MVVLIPTKHFSILLKKYIILCPHTSCRSWEHGGTIFLWLYRIIIKTFKLFVRIYCLRKFQVLWVLLFLFILHMFLVFHLLESSIPLYNQFETHMPTYEHLHWPVLIQDKSQNRTDSLSWWTQNSRKWLQLQKYEEIRHTAPLYCIVWISWSHRAFHIFLGEYWPRYTQ